MFAAMVMYAWRAAQLSGCCGAAPTLSYARPGSLRRRDTSRTHPTERFRTNGIRAVMTRSFPGIRTAMYALRGGFLVRPLLIAVTLGFLGAMLSSLEETAPAVSAWVPRVLFPSHADPQVAQIVLATIATSIMTVVSIVFAILLMTLTLASMQFSPRILLSFVKDRVTQWTLGIFLGTFAYCMAALPAARSLPHQFAPVATVTCAMLLSVICVAWLIFFIHHISQAISVNHIVDRIARETEGVIDDIMRDTQKYFYEPEGVPFDDKQHETLVTSSVSGYIRYVDRRRLLELAKAFKVRVRILRRVGHFVPEGVQLFGTTPADRVDAHQLRELSSAFDIGPTRTMQQDVEFGVIRSEERRVGKECRSRW